MTEEELNALTEKIIGCAFRVSNGLGCGFLEKVYERALIHELRKNGLRAEPQPRIDVYYDGVIVGEYFADILVEDVVILEVKATLDHHDVFTAQCLNHLKGQASVSSSELWQASPRNKALSRSCVRICLDLCASVCICG